MTYAQPVKPRTPYKGADATSEVLIAHYAGDPQVKIDDLLRLQRKWGPIFKAARRDPAAFVGQKYL